MNRIKIIKKNEIVIVIIAKQEKNNKYSFVNLTIGHICPREFDSIEEAILELKILKQKGEIIDYEII